MSEACETTSRYRLPSHVIPEHYDLHICPDLDTESFTGSVSITIDVREPVSQIVLNAKELEIASACVTGVDGDEIEVSDVVMDEELERATLMLDADIAVGVYDLRIEFSGILNRKLAGFYISTFTDTEGVDRKIATTQFESTDARRAFPCFDEPGMKATFDIAMSVPADLFAASNGPIVSDELSADASRRLVKFGRTIRMSTYLVAFIVGPFEATDPVDVDGVPLRVIHPIGKGHLADYALESGSFALRFFTDYYGIPYPGEKIDLVAVPDFAFGAMENLGCVTFREAILLVDRQKATQPELLIIADVIAHELAHMWFGDLVTMRWWNGIWLNEAFATFMATMCTDVFNPDWRRWDQFSLERSAAFDVDSLQKTRPIEYEVNSPSDADGMFDLLTYEKGGSVLRMLEQHLGADVFRDGIRHYLKRHQYGNTETSDLWDALEEISGEPVRSAMDAWIYQRGYPIVSVQRCDDCDKTILRQQRFYYSPPDVADSDSPQTWPIPMRIRYGNGNADDKVSELKLLFTNQDEEFADLAGASWIIANAGSNGFYRVRYSETLLSGIRDVMSDLAPIERYSLADDQWSALLAGQSSAVEYMALAESYRNEDDLDVWTLLSGCLSSLERIVDDPSAQMSMRIKLASLFRGALSRLSWDARDNDSVRDIELRGVLLRSLAVTARDKEALPKTRALHDAYLAGDVVEPNLAAAATAAVAVVGDDADYDLFVSKIKDPATPQEERRYRGLLASFPSADHMRRTLDMCLNGDVRTQDAPYLVGACLTNRFHGETAWDFVKNNWESMLDSYPDNSIVRMLGGIRSLSKSHQADDVNRFFETHDVPTGELILQQHLERLAVNVAFRERETPKLTDWLMK